MGVYRRGAFFFAGGFFLSPRATPARHARARPLSPHTRPSLHPPTHHFLSPRLFCFPQQGRVYVAVTTRGYNARFIYSSPDGSQRGVLGVLKKEILERFADVSLTAGPNGLSAKAGPILKSLCDEFNDLKSLDKIAGVQAKVDAVTNVMQSNISLALRNTDRIEDIDEKANTLAESANKFKVGATNLKNSERCKLIKCYAMVALVVITILGIIIGVAVNNNQKK